MNDFNTLELGQRTNGVMQITMSRPDVFNAFDETMIAELDAAFEQLSSDDDVRVIVLAGDGKHFSAGADLKWMQRASQESREWNLADARRFAAMLSKIDNCPKPTLARIQGAHRAPIKQGLSFWMIIATISTTVSPGHHHTLNDAELFALRP